MGFLDFLFGGGQKDPTITTVPAPAANIPNSNELNSIGVARAAATTPYTTGHYRPADYAKSVASTPNMVPQMHQMMGMGGGQQMGGGMGGGMQGGGGGMSPFGGGMGGTGFAQGGIDPGQGMMGNWSQANPALQQPQYSPIAWAMQLGQLFSQLAPMYSQQMGMPQQQQQQQQQQQPQGGGGMDLLSLLQQFMQQQGRGQQQGAPQPQQQPQQNGGNQ